MPTSAVSWSFSREMPEMTQVYGGAGRVYPVDHDWVADPRRSRLRFAYSPQDRPRITEQLINDALEAALAAGLVEPRTRTGLRQRSGTVRGVIGSRAVVGLDDGSVATVWEELTVPGVPLERVVVKGQAVTGAYDPASRQLDLRDALQFTDPASARTAVVKAYQVDDVVLADVSGVTDDAVSLRLLPNLVVDADREMVTSNPSDTLRGLFTAGEIVACRIVSTEPLRLRLDDVDDDEVPKLAPSLLPGGPAWLRLPEPAPQARSPATTATTGSTALDGLDGLDGLDDRRATGGGAEPPDDAADTGTATDPTGSRRTTAGAGAEAGGSPARRRPAVGGAADPNRRAEQRVGGGAGHPQSSRE